MLQTIQQMKFTPLVSLIGTDSVKKSLSKLRRRSGARSINGKPLKRRRSLHKFLHSEKQTQRGSTQNCPSCKNIRSVRVKPNLVKSKPLSTIRIRNNVKRRINVNIKPKLNIITDKMVLTQVGDERCLTASSQESSKSLDSVTCSSEN